jgi:hypothetical protein
VPAEPVVQGDRGLRQTLSPEHRHRVTLGRQRLDPEAVRRPPWAVAMLREALLEG